MISSRFIWRSTLLLILQIGCAKADRAHTVTVELFRYRPISVDIQSGDTVVFINRDAVPHTATAANGNWDTGEISPGASRRVVVNAAGEYFCAYHPNMKGTITTAGD